MTWLVLGLLLWVGGHLFKRVLPNQREALGKWGKPLVATVILVSIALMIVGYREADDVALYALPIWAWYLNNLLMLVALFMMDVGRVRGMVRTHIRHPMLLGVTIWSAAHLLVNGDLAALVLFGGLGAWGLLEMAIISRVEGPWQAPAKGSILSDGKVVVLAVVLYALIAGIHNWLDHPAIVFL
jgi:uncharacterized membrane protein